MRTGICLFTSQTPVGLTHGKHIFVEEANEFLHSSSCYSQKCTVVGPTLLGAEEGNGRAGPVREVC